MSKVTALIPIKNGVKFLPSSIESLESNQDFLERILVIEDGSTDSTHKLLQDWARYNSKVSVIRTGGIGLVGSLNLGISESSTDWVARFDVDDLYAKDRIEKQIAAINVNSAAVFSDYSLFSDKFGTLGTIPSAISTSAVGLSLRRNQRTAHPSALLNVAALKSVGGYREDDFPAEDYSLWLRLLKVGELSSVGEILLNYRISDTSISSQMKQEMFFKSNYLRKTIGMPRIDVDEATNLLELNSRVYQDLKDSNIRNILHFIDIKAALNDCHPKQTLKYQNLLEKLELPTAAFDSFEFGIMMLKRKIIKYLL